MRIILNNKYCIMTIIGNKVVSVGDNYDTIEVAIPTSSVNADNSAVRCFSFRLANGHEIGPFSVESSEDDGYVVFSCELSNRILTTPGKLQATATIMFTNESLLRNIKEKQVSIELDVLDAVVLEESLDIHAKLEELEARIEALEEANNA